MSDKIRNLEPKAVWNHFADLNEVPRPSKGEERVIAFMKNFGESLGLETIVDKTGNVIIKKPATAGLEDRPGVVLQSHLDMVHQKNSDTDFDFDSEGIKMIINGDWIKADGTTLGADNGIGVAAIMAVLSATDIPHPPVEGLFTIDEETGMSGALGLEAKNLDGRLLLNLDSEDDSELTIGCAGGIDTNVFMDYTQEQSSKNDLGFQIDVKGLKGGHSGMDIHKGRANANKVMNRLLYKMYEICGLQIGTINGGSLRNAIPRESKATVIIPNSKQQEFLNEFDRRKKDILQEFASIETDMILEVKTCDKPDFVMDAESQVNLVNALYALPNGVFRMSPDVPGLVETSSSLARVVVKDGNFLSQSLQRSAIESGKEDIANSMRAAFEAAGATVENEGSYPGWAPNAQSALLKTMQGLYAGSFGVEPKVAACHAGLECGIIGEHFGNMDMISFGPNIHHAHSPDETVSISSVERFWGYLQDILANIGG